MLDQTELNGRTTTSIYNVDSNGRLDESKPLAPLELPLLAIDSSKKTALVKTMMDKYDHDKDGKLTRSEIGLAPALFSKLDTNKNGFLSADELRAYFATEPDLVVRLQLGTPTKTKRKDLFDIMGLRSGLPLVVVNEKTMDVELKKRFRRAGSDTIAVALGDARIALQAASEPGQNQRFNRTRDFYLREYDRIVGKKAFVERSDEKGQRRYLFQIFTQADKNADGKLTRAELISWLNVVGTGLDANVTLTVNDLGRGLFPILDADGDGRLSLREMKDAWSRLKPIAKEGKVTQADLPRTLRIVVGQGNTTNLRRVPFVIGETSTDRPMSRGSAPVWFRKMDRNNDGDISPREWLGTDEEFRAIDTDGDGLISVEEAIAFEAKKNQKKD